MKNWHFHTFDIIICAFAKSRGINVNLNLWNKTRSRLYRAGGTVEARGAMALPKFSRIKIVVAYLTLKPLKIH